MSSNFTFSGNFIVIREKNAASGKQRCILFEHVRSLIRIVNELSSCTRTFALWRGRSIAFTQPSVQHIISYPMHVVQ